MPKWLLKTVEISGGFLSGLSLRLPAGLTCVIGPRGSGKSTLAEALRYGIGGSALSSNPSLFSANLGSSVITLGTTTPSGEFAYTIRRLHRQPPTLVTADGRAIETVDLDRGTFLPFDAYNSRQVEEIANETLGQKRRALLDELRIEELRSITLVCADGRRALDANADSIRASRRRVRDLTEKIEEIGDAHARLAALPATASDESTALLDLSKQQNVTTRELTLLSDALASMDHVKVELQTVGKKSNGSMVIGAISDGPFLHAIEMKQARAITDSARAFVLEKFAEIERVLTRSGEELQRLRHELETMQSQLSARVVELQRQNQAVSESVRLRTAAQSAVDLLLRLQEQRHEEQERLAKLLEERKELKARYLIQREAISRLRQTVAAELEKKTGPAVRVRVLANADTLAYLQLLQNGLKGARVRNHDEILSGLLRLRPEQLAEIIHGNDIGEFDELLGFGSERSTKILEAFAANVDPLELEVIDIDDRVCIELNVATAGPALYKDAAELSQGQKCTALLPLLLSRSEAPLLIDQPEDNLDNHFVYETVVDSVRRLKSTRQMIFITHNANIPVLGEADLVVVMNSDGKLGYVEKTGTLDECRAEIIDLLEGGEIAFSERAKRYARRS